MEVRPFRDISWDKGYMTTQSGETMSLRRLIIERWGDHSGVAEQAHYVVKRSVNGELLCIIAVQEEEREAFKGFMNAVVISKLGRT